MPSISFVADEDDFRTVLGYLNTNPDVAFIVAVAQDPTRDRVEVVAHAFDQGVERRFVAVHRSLDEDPLHPSPLGDLPVWPVRRV